MHFPSEILDLVLERDAVSHSDLARCALVCHHWYHAAHRHLLHSIDMDKSQMADLAISYAKLTECLKEHPDYVDMVHELVIQWTLTFAATLVQEIGFTNVQSVVFKNISWKKESSEDVMGPLKSLLHLASVQRVTFIDVTFHEAQWNALFDQCSPNIKFLTYIRTDVYQVLDQKQNFITDKPSLVGLKLFRGTSHRVLRWLIEPEACLFDLSNLQYLKYDLPRTPGQGKLSKVFNTIRDTLKTLEIYVPLPDESDSELVKIDIGPMTLPALTSLRLCHLTPNSVSEAVRFVSQLGSQSLVHTIKLDVFMFNNFDVAAHGDGWKNAFSSLDDALSYQMKAPLVKKVDVLVKRRAGTCNEVPDSIVQLWREILPQVNNMNLLSVSLEERKRWM
ncbi:hypothetical protein BDQ17DRAFT_539141 [Cyathus striatus]|nr:hypothetical protein BDQ17DRAFT_539141 [Cyathus striatus]